MQPGIGDWLCGDLRGMIHLVHHHVLSPRQIINTHYLLSAWMGRAPRVDGQVVSERENRIRGQWLAAQGTGPKGC